MPEIRLHKAQPTSGIGRLAEMGGGEPAAPYWSTWWGGGIALARYVLDHPAAVAGRRVLDLGTGSGLVAIAAARAGAARVVAADVDPYAIAVARMNAAANGVALSLQLGDLTVGEPHKVDTVLVGDLFYDPDMARSVTVFLDRCREPGALVLVGDPGRAYLPRTRLRLVAEYEGPEFAHWTGRSAVFEFLA